MNHRPIRLFPVLLAAALAASLLPAGAASAAPIDDKRAEAAALQSQIDANGRRIDTLSEEANGARYRRDQAQAARNDAQQRIEVAQAERGRLRALLGKRALDAYKGGGSSSPLDVIDVRNARELGARAKYATAAQNTQNKLVAQLRGAEEELATRQTELDAAIAQATAEQERIEASRSEIESANATQAQLLGQVQGELATLVQQEEQRRQAEAAARARALTAPRAAPPSPSGRSTGPANASGGGASWAGPAASGGAGAAIAFARSQLGKPYRYAASGPDSYDCSGLTMRAWQAGGVSMPHYSGAQYGMFPHVPLDALQPGDLVFWGPGGSNHVAMYTGGGNVIYAPQTGSFVKEGPIYGNPVGAARPG
ncbi:MAG: NlpC/P60 family protein [Acidimicrobiia bacterium]